MWPTVHVDKRRPGPIAMIWRLQNPCADAFGTATATRHLKIAKSNVRTFAFLEPSIESRMAALVLSIPTDAVHFLKRTHTCGNEGDAVPPRGAFQDGLQAAINILHSAV